jgi:hypothetical protein
MKYVLNDHARIFEITEREVELLVEAGVIAEHDYNPEDDPTTMREFFVMPLDHLPSTCPVDMERAATIGAFLGALDYLRSLGHPS